MKDTITEIFSIENQVTLFFKEWNVLQLLKQSNIKKEKGISLRELFSFLIGLVFTGKTFLCLLKSNDTHDGMGKDVVYRFFNSVSANWRPFLHLLASKVIVQKILPLTDATTPKVFLNP